MKSWNSTRERSSREVSGAPARRRQGQSQALAWLLTNPSSPYTLAPADAGSIHVGLRFLVSCCEMIFSACSRLRKTRWSSDRASGRAAWNTYAPSAPTRTPAPLPDTSVTKRLFGFGDRYRQYRCRSCGWWSLGFAGSVVVLGAEVGGLWVEVLRSVHINRG